MWVANNTNKPQGAAEKRRPKKPPLRTTDSTGRHISHEHTHLSLLLCLYSVWAKATQGPPHTPPLSCSCTLHDEDVEEEEAEAEAEAEEAEKASWQVGELTYIREDALELLSPCMQQHAVTGGCGSSGERHVGERGELRRE